MTKIPVKTTISECYRFAGTRYLELLGILWLPYLAYTALSFLLMRYLTARLLTKPQHSAGSMWYAVQGLHIFFSSIIGVAIVGFVLGTFTGSKVIYFRIGRAELWTFASLVLVAIFAYGIFIVGGVLGGVVGTIVAVSAGSQPISPGQFNPTVLMLLLFVLGISTIPAVFVAVRLGFFVVPISALENRLGLFRSWELTKGNFWRCFVITCAVILPVLLVGAVTMYIAYRHDMSTIIGNAFKPGALQAFLRIARSTSNSAPYFWPVAILLAPITVGLWMLPGPIVYRNLNLADAP